MKKNLRIEINDLTFKCIIGILDFEKIKKQRVIINISFSYEYSKNYFIDYSQVSKLVKSIMKNKKFGLLEEALIYLEDKLYKMYKINKLSIKISKPDILRDCIVTLSN